MVNVAEKEAKQIKQKISGFTLTVKISVDKMLAHLFIEQNDKDAVLALSKDELLKILNEAGVIYGINDERLSKISSEVILNKPIEVARGTPCGKGVDSSFELLFEAADSKAPVINEDGCIDYKNLNLIKNATKDQPLVKKIHAARGTPGKTVTGEDVEGKMGKDRALPKGKNTDISPDNKDLLIATKDGSITYANNLVSIDDTYTVNSDVDMASGNIDFVGSLKISGGIKSGFIVKANGNIEIGKNVEDAQVFCGGSVVAKGGFVSSEKGIIKAVEDVFVKYVENGTIEAGHDVNIGGGSMNANVIAGNSILLKGTKAVIVGGKATANNLIEVGTTGSEFGTPTLLRVGYSRKLMKEINEINYKIERLESDSERIKSAMYSLVRLELDNKLNEAQKEALVQFKGHQKEIPGQLENLENQKSELIQKLNENKKAKIVVRGRVFPGTIIQIGMLKREVNKVLSSCTFRISHDQIAFYSNS